MNHRQCVPAVLATCVLVFSVGSALAHTDIPALEAHDMIVSGGPIVLDVREYSEFCGPTSHIANAVNMPWNSGVLQARFSELPRHATVVVVCASGGRSHPAANFLDTKGFSDVYDMLGGMAAWVWGREACDTEPVLEVSGGASAVEIDWTPASGAQDYDLLRGHVEDLADATTFVDLGPVDCLANDSAFTYATDAAPVPAGGADFYLSRQKDGSWGRSSADQERLPASATCGPP